MKKKRRVSLIIACVMAFMIAAVLVCMIAEAKTPRNGEVEDVSGNVYIYKHGKLQTGYFRYKGRTYYGHRTKSACYPVGSIAKSTYRVRNGRMYYFDEKGRKITRSTKYIKLFPHRTSVHYIQPPASNERFNARTQRWQRRVNGKWKSVGMQNWPYGWVDWQE